MSNIGIRVDYNEYGPAIGCAMISKISDKKVLKTINRQILNITQNNVTIELNLQVQVPKCRMLRFLKRDRALCLLR